MSVTARLAKDTFTVREQCSVEIEITSTEDLVPGDTVEVQFPNSWYVVSGPSHTRELQTADPSGRHYISARASGGKGRFDVTVYKRHLTFPEGSARHGRHIVATLTGARIPPGAPVLISYANTYAPYIAEAETLWIRAKGSPPAEAPRIKTTGGPAEYIRVIAPSGARPGESFEVLVVSLDEFENRSSSRFENERLALSDGSLVAGDLSFTGSVRVPVTLDHEGVYRFECCGVTSNAVRVGANAARPYWGDIHVHTKVSSDGQGTDPYVYAREVSGLDFAGMADHWESIGERGYEILLEWARRADVPGEFATILGDERCPAVLTGHHNLYFRDEETFIERRAIPERGADGALEDPEWRDLDPDKAMFIPHHTGIEWGALEAADGVVNLAACDDCGLRPSVEIYSHHGQSELYSPQHILAYEFNRMRNPEKRSNTSVAGPYYAQDYWKMGRRLGVIASSDDHSGRAGRRHGGIAAVWTDELTREAVFDAIKEQRSYGTTGERILVDFSVDGKPMGSQMKVKRAHTVKVKLDVWGTELLLRVEVLRLRFGVDESFAQVLSASPKPQSTDASFEFEDDILADAAYYARVTQEPLEWPGMAWTTPVWIDIE